MIWDDGMGARGVKGGEMWEGGERGLTGEGRGMWVTES